jgi:L-2-hydroxyglutarate oxidase LhgO
MAFAREGYQMTDLNLRDFTESLFNPRFLKLAWKYWPVGMGEMWRSVSTRAFVRALQRLVPGISAGDLIPAPAGVRAQALGKDGSLIDDFVIQESPRIINVGNAPSPAATSSLRIGTAIVDKIAERMR